MKILLANYRYFISGGPERYLFNITDALENRGHEVIPFSINYTKNRPTPYSRYFVSPLGNENDVYFRDQPKNIRTIWKTTKRLFFDKEVEDAARRITSDTKPDVAYILHYLRKLSPALLVGLKKARIPIVVRLSDYAMLCPQAHFLRNESVCELCLQKNLFYSVRYKCVQHSCITSLLNLAATAYQRYKKYFDLIDMFVVTNEFMYQKMLEAGYPKSHLKIIPTFVNLEDVKLVDQKETGLIVYVGRLEEIKGVHILISAIHILKNKFSELFFRVKIFGDGNESYTQRLKEMVKIFELNAEIEFCGKKDFSEISQYLSKAQVSIVPSLWYENLPNVILESYASGTAVLASNLGSLPYVVTNLINGYLFNAGDPTDLAEKLSFCLQHQPEMAIIGKNNCKFVEKEYSKENHILALEKLFCDQISLNNRVIQGRNRLHSNFNLPL